MLSYLYCDNLVRGIKYFGRLIRNEYYKRKLKGEGKFCIYSPFVIKGNIQIGNGFRADRGLILIALQEYRGEKFDSSIEIGNNFDTGFDCHIGAINRIEIGNNVLFGSKVYITDHFHGNIKENELEIPPIERPLISKGEVIIKDNVWIGDNVVIMPNVVIEEGCIIGANAVVTKSIPTGSVVAGVPAKIIKRLDGKKQNVGFDFTESK